MESVIGNLDRVMFVEHIQYKVVIGRQDKFVVVQTQHRLVDQVQDKFGTIGIVFVDIVGKL